MFQKTKISGSRNTTVSGYADTAKISTEKISGLIDFRKRRTEEFLKNGSSTVAYLDGNYFVKCNPARSFTDSLRKLFCRSRAENSRVMAEKLIELGIPTPEVLCAVREKRHCLVVCDCLVTSALPKENIVFLHRLRKFEFDRQNRIIEEIAKIIFLLNKNNICHGDASLRNFYLDNITGKVGTIDLDGCRKINPLLKKRSLIREAARVISSCMISANDLSEEKYRTVSQIFINICPSDALPEKHLKKMTEKFISKTRKKLLEDSEKWTSKQ